MGTSQKVISKAQNTGKNTIASAKAPRKAAVICHPFSFEIYFQQCLQLETIVLPSVYITYRSIVLWNQLSRDLPLCFQPTPVLLPGKFHGLKSLVGCSPWGREGRTGLSDFTFTFHFHALEKEMATHSNVPAWRIPGTAESGGLPSMGSHRVGHD